MQNIGKYADVIHEHKVGGGGNMLMHPIQALRKHFRREILGHLYFTWDGVKNFGKIPM